MIHAVALARCVRVIAKIAVDQIDVSLLGCTAGIHSLPFTSAVVPTAAFKFLVAHAPRKFWLCEIIQVSEKVQPCYC